MTCIVTWCFGGQRFVGDINNILYRTCNVMSWQEGTRRQDYLINETVPTLCACRKYLLNVCIMPSLWYYGNQPPLNGAQDRCTMWKLEANHCPPTAVPASQLSQTQTLERGAQKSHEMQWFKICCSSSSPQGFQQIDNSALIKTS